MKGIGIKYKLRLATLIPVLLVAILFALFYNGQFSKDLSQHLSRLGRAYIRQLLPAVQYAMLRNDGRTLQGLINASTINPEIKALAFYDFKGHLIAYHGGKHSIRTPFKPPEYTGDYIESKPISRYIVNFIAPITIPKFNLYSTTPFKASKDVIALDADDILGWLSIDIDTKSLIIKRYQMYIITIFITLIGLLCSLVIHYLLSGSIYKPILKLRRSMRLIKNNQFDTPIATNSSGELGDIEKGCSYLQQQYLQLSQELGHHIETATADLQQSLESLEEKNIELVLEKKKIEEKSLQKSEFISNMSHEIRTPMSGILGFINVLRETKLDPLQLDYVKTIQASSQDLLSIINDILDYSKIEAGKMHLDVIPLDLRLCFDEVIALATPIAHKKGIDLIVSTDTNVPRNMLGDPLRIKQILTNLINNAIKFTEKGHVLVRTSIDTENDKEYHLSIAVSDTGMGISEEDQIKLFNAFIQADTTITRRFGGSGLGLIICKELAEAMQGQISLISELHKGSTFTVKIITEKISAYEEIEKQQSLGFGKIRALCFDENALHREALCNALGYLGIAYTAISNIRQLEKALQKNPERTIALININEGSEHQIGELIKNHSIPSILVSKWLIPNYETLGAKAFLYKPVPIQKLHDAIESVLNCSHPIVTQETNKQHLRQAIKAIYPNVLIAEDNPVNQMLMQSFFKGNALVTTVENGEEAVNACNEKLYHILLLDLQMPKLNGLEAAMQIREKSLYNQATPIILITANTGDLPQQTIHKAGIDLCLQKTIDEKQFLKQILKMLNKDKTSVIDWSLCIQKASGNKTLAKEFMARFVQELKKDQKTFKELLTAKDIQGLENAAHKLYGACCFCGVPRLEDKTSRLESAAKKATKISELKFLVNELLQCIEEVIEMYESKK